MKWGRIIFHGCLPLLWLAIFRSGLYFYFFNADFTWIRSLSYSVQDSPELADLFELREESGASLCQEVTKLTTALQEYQLMVQVR